MVDIDHIRSKFEVNSVLNKGSSQPQKSQEATDVHLLPFLEIHPHPAFLLPASQDGTSTSTLEPAWSNQSFKSLVGNLSLAQALDSVSFQRLRAALREQIDTKGGSHGGSVGFNDTILENQPWAGSVAEHPDVLYFKVGGASLSPESAATTVPSSLSSYNAIEKAYEAVVLNPLGSEFTLVQLTPRTSVSRMSNSVSSNNHLHPVTSTSRLIPVNGQRRSRATSQSQPSKGPANAFSHSSPSHSHGHTKKWGGTHPTIQKALDMACSSNGSEEATSEALAAVGLSRKTALDLLDTIDWSKTVLGPRNQWPQSLKSVISLVMGNQDEACVWWGVKDRVLLYNEAFASTRLDVQLFGKPCAHDGKLKSNMQWDILTGPPTEVCISSGLSVRRIDDLLFLQAPGQSRLLETYHTWSRIPIRVEGGDYGGMYHQSLETTERVIAQRRLLTLRELSSKTWGVVTFNELIDAIMETCRFNPKDIPFALLYETTLASDAAEFIAGLQREFGEENSGLTSCKMWRKNVKMDFKLKGSIGVPDVHPSAPSRIILDYTPTLTQTTSMCVAAQKCVKATYKDHLGHLIPVDYENFPWPIVEPLLTKQSVLVEDCAAATKDFEHLSPWDGDVDNAICIPLQNPDCSESSKQMVLVLGLNTRRPFDNSYADWIEMLRTQICTLLSSVESFEFQLKKTEELAKLDAAKIAFFSNISHELRTPLTLIQAPLTDLAAHEAGKDQTKKKMLDIALRNANRLGRLVDQLMDVSRVEAGRLSATFRPVNLGVYTQDLASLFRSAIEKGGVKYVVECDEGDKKPVFVDSESWEKIIFNLIGNSFKFTSSGQIRVSLIYMEDHVEMSVEDSGVGIRSQDISHVTERFHRVETTSRSHEGTGIGLNLTLELVKLHGGTLSITSTTAEENPSGAHGSTFTVSLPLGTSHLPEDRVEHSADGFSENSRHFATRGMVEEAANWIGLDRNSDLAMSDSGYVSSSDRDGTSLSLPLSVETLFWSKEDTILIADDNGDMLSYLNGIFSRYCTVLLAKDGQEALELATVHKPNLILSDVSMPRLSGYELLHEIRQATESSLNLIPIILLTARAEEEEKISGLVSGADDHVQKPFKAKELVARCHLAMITGKKRVELEQKFSERTQEIRLLSDSSPNGVFRADVSGSISYVNQSFLSMSGHPAERPLNSWFDNVCKEDLGLVKSAWSSVFESSADVSVDFRFWRTGKYVHVLLVHLGGSLGLLGTMTDITERKQLEEERQARLIEQQRLTEEAEERRRVADYARKQQELIVDVTSHEIRNPVSAILQISSLAKGNFELLRKELDAAFSAGTPLTPTKELLNLLDEDIDGLESIYQSAASQQRIADDILSLARIQLDTFTIHPALVNLQVEAQKLVSSFAAETRSKHIALDIKLGTSLTRFVEMGVTQVMSDSVRLGQVFINLISNAIKFTENAQKREIEVGIDLSRSPPIPGTCEPSSTSLEGLPHPDDEVYIYGSVRDSGPGLAQLDLSKLFQKFAQASQETQHVFGGSGLGLYVCRRITELMGGGIEVSSKETEGCLFRFYVKTKISPTHPTLNTTVPQQDLEFTSREPPKVLVVEDNLINQKVLKRQLLKGGCSSCETADDGIFALEQLEGAFEASTDGKRPFHLILCDLEMPRLSGLGCIKIIREREADKTFPSRSYVVALTGNAREGQVKAALAAGFDEVVTKPYKIDDLLRILRDAPPR